MDKEPTVLKTFALTMLHHENFKEHWVQIDVYENYATMHRGVNTHADINGKELIAEETTVDSDGTDEQMFKLGMEALLDMVDAD